MSAMESVERGEGRVCALASCGKVFYRSLRATNFTWSQRRYCNQLCQSRAAQLRYRQREEQQQARETR